MIQLHTATAGQIAPYFRHAVLYAMLCIWMTPAYSQTAVTLQRSLVGNYNFQATGGSFRTEPNTGNSCAIAGTSTSTITGIPLTATVLEAHLYWAASGSPVDSSVTLNGSSVTAGRTFSATFPFDGNNLQFYSGVADVTAIVTGNGTYTVTGITVANVAPWCGSGTVMGGWALVIIYEDAGEPLQAVNIYDGFDLFRGGALTLTPSNFRVPTSPIQGKYTNITWEGDPQNSATLNGFGESLVINGTILDDGINPPASSPLLQPFDGTINAHSIATSYGVDVDTFSITPLINAGDTAISSVYSSGGDLVFLSAQVIAVTTDPFADLAVSKSHTGDFNVGVNGQYTIQVTNNGPEPEPNPINIQDTLPAGLGYVSGVGGGWICGAAGQDVSCHHAGPLSVGASLPDLTITVDVQPAAIPSITNTVTVSSTSTDFAQGNNSASDPTNVMGADLVIIESVQLLSDPFNGTTNPVSIPGSIHRYTITVINQGSEAVDSNSLTVTDVVPPSTSLFVDTSGGDPIVFVDGATSSGLSYNFATNVGFSNQPGGIAPFDYVPIPDADGFDTNVTGFQASPTGVMIGEVDGNQPSFDLLFTIRID